MPLRPHVIAHRVNASPVADKVNFDEARSVAALLIAATEHSAYDGKTFGVISLLGDDQALEIDRILRQRLDPESLRPPPDPLRKRGTFPGRRAGRRVPVARP